MTLVLSPHLDDAAFSCGALLAGLGDATVVTCFTESVSNPTGFALDCQRDKNLPDEVDYMALRRKEDREAMQRLGCAYSWWPYREAPHRGYDSASDLFAGIHAEDKGMAATLSATISDRFVVDEITTLLYPYGAGNHVDHLQVIEAVSQLGWMDRGIRFIQYLDQPYSNRYPDARPQLAQAPTVSPAELAAASRGYYRLLPTDSQLEVKYLACAAYRSQVPFQFGGDTAMRELLGRWEYYFVH